MNLCVDCYKEIYRNRSRLIWLSNEKEVCDNCKKKKFLVLEDYPGEFIIKNYPTFLEIQE